MFKSSKTKDKNKANPYKVTHNSSAESSKYKKWLALITKLKINKKKRIIKKLKSPKFIK